MLIGRARSVRLTGCRLIGAAIIWNLAQPVSQHFEAFSALFIFIMATTNTQTRDSTRSIFLAIQIKAAEHRMISAIISEGHRTSANNSAPIASLEPYGALKDRCIMIPGYYQDTLNDALKAKMQAEKRRIGFAFLDCNLGPSYKLIFDFLIDVIGPYRMFIYLDEYFIDTKPSVNVLYDEFAAAAKRRYDLNSIYVRNAAGCGALFCLVPNCN
jgi:hypothetical protein